MKVGFCEAEAVGLYNQLSTEAFDIFDYPGRKPKFVVDYPFSSLLSNSCIAETNFYPADSIAEALFAHTMGFQVDKWAYSVRIHPEYLPILHEDELIAVLVHEIAHVVVGLEASHDENWAEANRRLGGYDSPNLLPRLVNLSPTLERFNPNLYHRPTVRGFDEFLAARFGD